MEKFTDEELMQRVMQGDLDMMSYLYNRYHLKIYNFSFLMTRDKDVSKDITQEAFYKVIKYRKTYKNARFSSWIYTIARNLCNDYYRTLKKTEQPVYDLQLVAERAETTENETIGNIAQLNAALNQLNISDKELIIMSRYQGMKHREIAEITNSTAGAVKTKIHRALYKLKDVYFTNTRHDEL